jgi:uncharacterized protein (TIGR02687 family)
LEAPQIVSALKRLYDEEDNRIVFWCDPQGEFVDSVEQISSELPQVKLARLDSGSTFQLKMELELEHPEQRYLLYEPQGASDREQDWLLDIRLYAQPFFADKASVVMDELGLLNHSLRPFLNERMAFFNKARIKALKARVNPEDGETEIDLKMMAVLAKAEQADFFSVVQALFLAMASDDVAEPAEIEEPEPWRQIEKMNLADSFSTLVQSWFGYQADKFSLPGLLRRLLVTDFAAKTAAPVPPSLAQYVLPEKHWENVLVCLSQWRDRSSLGFSYDRLSAAVCADLDLKPHFGQMPVESLYACFTFLEIEKRLLSSLRDQVIERAAAMDAAEIQSIVHLRRDGHWVSAKAPYSELVPRAALRDVYSALEHAARLFELKNRYAAATPVDDAVLVRSYLDEWFLIDQEYRLFNEKADSAERMGWDLLKSLYKEVEQAYTNGYLIPMGLQWSEWQKRLADASADWAGDSHGLVRQWEFYRKCVKPLQGTRTAQGIRKVFVIISDALRYEVAQELVGELNGTYRFSAELDALWGVVPSYTGLGMAALLPHDELAYLEKGDLRVDGSGASSLELRNAILQRYKGMVVKAEDLRKMKKDEGRECVRAAELVYVYHNTIDASGDSASTESDTFRAVREAIEQVAELTRYIVNTLNGSQIFITADHGFLFTQESPGEVDKSSLGDKPDSAVKTKKRYVLGKNLPPVEHVLKGSVVAAGGSMDFWVPKGAARFYFTGGARFVHGGAMPQEMLVPLIQVGHVRDKKAATTKIKKVDVQLLGGSQKITTASHRFQFIQTEAVGERSKSITLEIAVYDGANPVTDIARVTFDSKSDNFEDRKKWVSLSLKQGLAGRSLSCHLIARDPDDDGREVLRSGVVIKQMFEADF